MTMVLEGEYRDVRRFIHALETAPEFVVIEDVALVQGERNAPLTLTSSSRPTTRRGRDGRAAAAHGAGSSSAVLGVVLVAARATSCCCRRWSPTGDRRPGAGAAPRVAGRWRPRRRRRGRGRPARRARARPSTCRGPAARAQPVPDGRGDAVAGARGRRGGADAAEAGDAGGAGADRPAAAAAAAADSVPVHRHALGRARDRDGSRC